jgi:hypothetical protein
MDEQAQVKPKWLKFATFADAYRANAVISHNMQLSCNRSIQFCTPREALDGSGILDAYPESEAYLQYVEGYTVIDADRALFGESEEGE